MGGFHTSIALLGCCLYMVVHCACSFISWIGARDTLCLFFDMDIEDSKQHPWLEYSVWQDQEWVRIYTPGQPQLWQPGETVPDLPDNSFREWQRVTDPSGGTGEHGQAWTIRDWQHQGYQRILSRRESFTTHHARDQALGDVQNSDAIPVEETFTYATPFSHGDRSTAAQLASVLYGDTRNAQRGDLSLPSSERFRAVSRSPRRGGFFGQR